MVFFHFLAVCRCTSNRSITLFLGRYLVNILLLISTNQQWMIMLMTSSGQLLRKSFPVLLLVRKLNYMNALLFCIHLLRHTLISQNTYHYTNVHLQLFDCMRDLRPFVFKHVERGITINNWLNEKVTKLFFLKLYSLDTSSYLLDVRCNLPDLTLLKGLCHTSDILLSS